MQHFFNVEAAKKIGVIPAVLLTNLKFWIDKNKANNENEHYGLYWTYNSKKAWAELFPYLSERQIDYALSKLIKEEYILSGNYNKSAYDRTLWYAITNKGESILQNCEMKDTILYNQSNENVQPIPDINTDINANKNTDSINSIVLYLNTQAGTAYKPNSKATRRLINARLNEGFSVMDFYKVINKKVAEWKGGKMEQYIRPETLFGTKFESYLNSKTVGANGVVIDESMTELDDLF